MSQYDFGTIDPYTDDGVTLADMLNNWRDAIHSWHRGAARPSYAVPGMAWINDTGGPTNWLVNVSLGPTVGDVVLFTYDTTTGVISNGGGMLLAQAAADPSVRWQATGNAANLRAWRATEKSDGTLRFGAYNDAGVEVAGITFQRDGKLIADLSGSSGIPSSLVVGATPPASPQPNQLWWNSDNSTAGGGRLYLYFVDVDTSQWVPASPPLGIAWTAGPTFDVSTAGQSSGATTYAGGDNPMTISMGAQIFSRSFTASDPTHAIEVDIVVNLQAPNSVTIAAPVVGLFIDGATNAVAQTVPYLPAGTGTFVRVYWQGVLSAGAHTFSVRFAGFGANGIYSLTSDGGHMGGGAMRNTMTIREVGVGAQGPPGPAGAPGASTNFLQFKRKEITTRGSLTGTISSGNAAYLPTLGNGAVLDSIDITPIRADSVLEVEIVAKGNPTASDVYVITMFNGSAFVDQEMQYQSAGNQIAGTLRMKSVMPSPGTAPITLNFRIGSNSNNTWRQGQVNNGSTSDNNLNLHSWITVREMLAAA